MANKLAVSEDQVYDALRVIVKNRNLPALNYAVNYAKYGLGTNGHELYVQVLYTMNNVAGWRGEEARATKDVLKQFMKEQKGK